MKERLLTFALAVGALALFYALFVPKPVPKGAQITQPLTTETGPNGYSVLYRWLDSEHIRVQSFRDRYDKLSQASVERSGNLLITTMPHRLSARPNEIAKLRAWVGRGNTLLIMAGLADTPDWSMDGQHRINLIAHLRNLIGVEFYSARADDKNNKPQADDEEQDEERTKVRFRDALQKLLEPKEREFSPVGSHPLFAGVQSVAALSEFPADDWQARPKDSVSAVLELAQVSSTARGRHTAAFWLANYEHGQIIVSGFASPFVNKLIGQHDNAQLLANIVAWSASAQGSVLFDDAHQGAVVFYDPQAFFADPRLLRALGWVLLIWLVFVLGPSQLRAVRSKWNPVDIVSFVRATGGFMARTLRPNEAGRRACTLFFNGVRRRLGLPENGAPVWDWLDSQSAIAAADYAQLRVYYEQLSGGRQVDFPSLHNLIERMKGCFV